MIKGISLSDDSGRDIFEMEYTLEITVAWILIYIETLWVCGSRALWLPGVSVSDSGSQALYIKGMHLSNNGCQALKKKE
jgi:hypothetical protein